MLRIATVLALGLFACGPAIAETGAYLLPAEGSSSVSLAHHAATGLQAAFIGFGTGNGNTLYYAACSNDSCERSADWRTVSLKLPQALKAQLALTPDGKPRILGAGWSPAQANGTDYYFAQCDQDCLNADNWRIGKIASTADGVMSNLYRDRLPERTFAIDENGNPRFMVSDSNYAVEPDHYGGFYLSCDGDCTNSSSWTETNLANQVGYNSESFSYPVLALSPGGGARVIASVYAFDEKGNDLEDGLYYYECDESCQSRANWKRTRVISQGNGSYPNPTWSMEVTSDGRPRVALFTGYGADIEGLDRKLLYIYCDDDCTKPEGENWFGYPLGLGDSIGESPDIKLDAAGLPHIAFTTKNFEIGYASCTAGCEDSNSASWTSDFAERSAAAAADRPTAIPYTCDGEIWSGMEPSLTLVADMPVIGYDLAVEARCLYKEWGKPEIIHEFHEIWRGSRVLRP